MFFMHTKNIHTCIRVGIFISAYMLWAWFSPYPSAATQNQTIPWKNLEKGLAYVELALSENTDVRITLLRFEPTYFTFTLHMASEIQQASKSLNTWAKEHDLVAAINASMYLPDGHTSTGYMRHKNTINNNTIGKNLGAFFVAMPQKNGLPIASIISRDHKNWKELLLAYDIVVQNYRMIDAQKNILWPKDGARHAIAAVAEDEQGHIFFIHCRKPLTPHDFATALLALPLDLCNIMYVEGGVQAGLVLRSKHFSLSLGGQHPMGVFTTEKADMPLPNVLGVRRKTR